MEKDKIVAHISDSYFNYSENWIHTQVSNLSEWTPLVLTNKAKNLEGLDWIPEIYERDENIPIVLKFIDKLIDKLTKFQLLFFWKAKRKKIKLIQAHFGPIGYKSLRLSNLLHIPIITRFYGFDLSMLPNIDPKWRNRYLKLFRNGNLFIVEGQYMGKQLEMLGCPSQKIAIHHLGININDYPLRKFGKQNVNNDVLKILMIGRFVEKKGFIYGLKAFKIFKDKGNKGVLTIVGDSDDTLEGKKVKEEIKNFVDQNNLIDDVIFRGVMPLNLLKMEYYKHEVLVAPSVMGYKGDNEGGLPVSVIEAAATGMPIIGTRHCDIPEVIKQNITGFLVEEKDFELLSEYLIKFYKNKELINSFGINAHDLIIKEYDATKQGKKLEEIYNSVVKRKE